MLRTFGLALQENFGDRRHEVAICEENYKKNAKESSPNQ